VHYHKPGGKKPCRVAGGGGGRWEVAQFGHLNPKMLENPKCGQAKKKHPDSFNPPKSLDFKGGKREGEGEGMTARGLVGKHGGGGRGGANPFSTQEKFFGGNRKNAK
jgi:hypothetical protein